MRIVIVLLLGAMVAMEAGASLDTIAYTDQTVMLDGSQRQVRIPQGYRLELLTRDLKGPRLLTFADNGDLFIGSKSGRVYRLPPPYTESQVLVTLDDYPHSVAFRPGEILIARTSGLYHAPYTPGQSSLSAGAVKLLAALPGGQGHNSRTVAVGPDGRVYAGIGISGNCSNEYLSDDYIFRNRRGGIVVLREKDGEATWETFASGLRNPVGFAWHPVTGDLYASNNGPDHLGYEQPPEYFSRLNAGSFHGMPWFQFDGRRLFRDRCIKRKPPRPMEEVTPPVVMFPSRSAPMGVTFVPGGGLTPALEGDAVVALRGSWGTLPSGGFDGSPATRRPPKLVIVRFDEGQAKRVDDLVTGFQLQDGKRWARLVGVAMGPDGALYFTSDSNVQGLFRLSAARGKKD